MTLIFAIVLGAALCACGSESNDESGNQNESEETTAKCNITIKVWNTLTNEEWN